MWSNKRNLRFLDLRVDKNREKRNPRLKLNLRKSDLARRKKGEWIERVFADISPRMYDGDQEV